MKKVFSILLAAAMLISCLSIVSFAAETKGAEVTVNKRATESENIANIYVTSDGKKADFSFLAGQKDADGKVTLKVKVYNDGDVDASVRLLIQKRRADKATSGDWGYYNVSGSPISGGKGTFDKDYVTAPAKQWTELSYTVYLNANNKISTINDISALVEENTGISSNDDVSVRFDMRSVPLDGNNQSTGFDAGTKFIIAPVNNDSLTDPLTRMAPKGVAQTNGVFTVSGATELPAETTPAPATPTPATPAPATPTPAGEENTPATATPVPKVANGVKYTVKEDIESEQYICSDLGVIDASDVKNGKLTKALSIKNNGDTEIAVLFRIQATVKGANGSNTWDGPNNGSGKVTIEPGKTEKLEFTCDSDGTKVTILEQDVTLDKLFFRFEVYGEGGINYLPAGTAFTVLCDTDEAEKLFAGNSYSNKENIVRELSYGTNGNAQHDGDILPVAFISVAVISAAALVVVTKKKKEIA